MAYTKQSWVNNDPTKPLSATRLNKLETQYDEALSQVATDVANDASVIGGALSTKIDVLGGATFPRKSNLALNAKDFEANGDGIQASGASIANGSANLSVTGANFTTADIGKTVTVVGAGAGGAALVATITGRTSTSAVTLSAPAAATVSGAVATWGTNDTAAIQAFFDAVTTQRVEGFVPAGIYLVDDEIKIGSSTSVGTDRWRVFARNATLRQIADNKCILRFWKEGMRNFAIDGLGFSWTTTQPYTNTRASAILFDSDTDRNDGFYNFQFSNLQWYAGARGISINESNPNRNPVWGALMQNLFHGPSMSGPCIKLVQTGSGQPNATIRNVYIRGDGFNPSAGSMIELAAYHGVVIEAVEFNDCTARELFLTSCDAVQIHSIRSERGQFTRNLEGLWTLSDCRAYVGVTEVQSKVFNVPASWAFVWRVLGSTSDVHFAGPASVSSLTLTAGQVAYFNADTAGVIEISATLRNGSGITKIYQFDDTPKRIVRDRNDFYGRSLRVMEISGAGKTTMTDADMAPNGATDRTVVIVRDTSTGNAKLAVRANGTWRHVALT